MEVNWDILPDISPASKDTDPELRHSQDVYENQFSAAKPDRKTEQEEPTCDGRPVLAPVQTSRAETRSCKHAQRFRTLNGGGAAAVSCPIMVEIHFKADSGSSSGGGSHLTNGFYDCGRNSGLSLLSA